MTRSLLRMHPGRAAPALVALGIVLSLGGRSAPAAGGGCSVSTAPVIASGATEQVDRDACPDHYEYWAIDARIGDRLTVDATAGGSDTAELGVYGPDVGAIGGTPLCQATLAGPAEASCLIAANGRYVLTFDDADVSFTARIAAVPPARGRVSGACDAVDAPSLPPGVTQYANANLCASAGRTQYWALRLFADDLLTIDVSTFDGHPDDQAVLDVFGPTAGAPGGKPRCGAPEFDPQSRATCSIHSGGRYLVASEIGVAVSFTARVVHHTTLVRGALVDTGSGEIFDARVRSAAPHPVGVCVLEEKNTGRWTSLGRARTTNGICAVRVRLPRSPLVLRLRFTGGAGWAPSSTAPFAFR